jgi:hypothetical protein
VVTDPVTVSALRGQLDAALRGPATLAAFASWWEANARDALSTVTYLDDPRGSQAIDLCRVAMEELRAGRLGDADLVELLRLAREAFDP